MVYLHPWQMTPFHTPQLLTGAVCHRKGNSFEISLGEHSFDLNLESDALCDCVGEVLCELQEGKLTADELGARFDSRLSPYHVKQLVALLAGQSVLTERVEAPHLRSGVALYHEVRAEFLSSIAPRFATEPGILRFHRADLSAKEIEAWSIEYYFTTRYAEQCLITALDHRSDPALRECLEEFFIDEVGHDRLLHRSLVGFGYSHSDIDGLTPHISTVAAMGMLLRSSIYDLPFFITLVGQMEGSEKQSRSYIEMLERSGLPQEAIHSQIVHERINIEHGHFGEALELANRLGAVSGADIARCKRLLRLYLEMRCSVYPHVLHECASPRALDATRLGEAWARYAGSLRRSVLPIAVASSPEPSARRFARDYVELRKVPLIEWDPADPIHVAAAVLDYSLWKTAYQNSEMLDGAFSFLDDLAEGRQPVSRGEPSFLSRFASLRR